MAPRERIPTPLTERLQQARQVAGLSNRKLSQLARLPESTCRMVEDGLIHEPAFRVIAALAEALGVSIDWLASGVGAGPSTRRARRAIAAAEARLTAEQAA